MCESGRTFLRTEVYQSVDDAVQIDGPFFAHDSGDWYGQQVAIQRREIVCSESGLRQLLCFEIEETDPVGEKRYGESKI